MAKNKQHQVVARVCAILARQHEREAKQSADPAINYQMAQMWWARAQARAVYAGCEKAAKTFSGKVYDCRAAIYFLGLPQ